MSVVASSEPGLTRRRRAARTVAAALRWGMAAGLAAGAGWLLAAGIAGTVFVLLVIATLGVAGYAVFRSGVAARVWLVLAVAWAIVLLERAIVQENGGVWVSIAAYLGVIVGARRAGISKWSLPLLAYPAISVAIVVLADEPLLDPWGISWLWLAAVLGPILAARTLLTPRAPATDQAAERVGTPR